MLISSERPPIIAGTLCGDSCPTNGEETKAMFQQKDLAAFPRSRVVSPKCYDRSFLNLGSLQSSEQSEHCIFCIGRKGGFVSNS